MHVVCRERLDHVYMEVTARRHSIVKVVFWQVLLSERDTISVKVVFRQVLLFERDIIGVLARIAL